MGDSIRPWIAKVFGLPVRTTSGDEKHHRRILAEAINEVGRSALSCQTAFDELTDETFRMDGVGAGNREVILTVDVVSPVPWRACIVADVNLRKTADAGSALRLWLYRDTTLIAERRIFATVNTHTSCPIVAVDENLQPETAYTFSVQAFVTAAGEVWEVPAGSGQQRSILTVRVEPQLPEVT